MAFENSVVGKDWTFSVIVPLYKGKEDRTECKNYRGIGLLSLVGKIDAGILVFRLDRVNEGLTEEEQRRFR